MDHGVEWPVKALGGSPPGIELAEMVQHRRQPMLDEVGLGAGEQAVQHVDRMLGQNLAERDALVDMSDEELPAAVRRQTRPDGGRTGAVGVGLEYRGAVDRLARGAPGIAQATP